MTRAAARAHRIRLAITEGCPGGGKSTQLKEAIERTAGLVSESDILAVTFTRNATAELRRAMNVAEGDDNGLTISTLHSLCYRHLPGRRRIIDKSQLEEVCDTLDLEERPPAIDRWGHSFVIADPGDNPFFSALSIARSNGVSIAEANWKFSLGLPAGVVRHYGDLAKQYAAVKRGMGVLDFQDVLEQFQDVLEQMDRRWRYVFVDEGQDLTPLQWDIVSGLVTDGGNLLVYRDVNQTLFRWAGASPGYLDQAWSGEAVERTLLDKSHRCPEPVAAMGRRVLERADDALNTDWLGHGGPAKIGHATPQQVEANELLLEYADRVEEQGGEMLITALFNHRSQKLYDSLRAAGFMVKRYKGDEPNEPYARAAQTFLDLKAGALVPRAAIKTMLRYTSAAPDLADYDYLRYGQLFQRDLTWREALDQLPNRRDDVGQMLQRRHDRYGRMAGGGSVVIDTVHSSKGAESRYCVFDATPSRGMGGRIAMSPKLQKLFVTPCYVGLTRTSGNMLIIRTLNEADVMTYAGDRFYHHSMWRLPERKTIAKAG